MLCITFLSILAVAAAFPSTGKFHRVPLQNGSFQLMSDAEVQQILKDEEINPHFDAYDDIVFHLYTQSNPTVSQVIKIDDATSLRNSNFDASLPTRFLVHGWKYDHTLFFVQQAKTQYLAKGRFNVIGVDWSKGGGTSNYVLARGRVNAAGKTLGQFIQFLEREGRVNINNVVLVGYSLGGHMVGNAGKQLGGRLPCIFALDPAGPLFFLADSDRVMQSDAKYVEVIHSNTDSNGFTGLLGHTDFYPNGGGRQPGCGSDHGCSHDRGPYYFIESINGATQFIGRRCSSLESITSASCDFMGSQTKRMGGEPYLAGSGIYHLITNDRSPFARG